MKNVFLIAGDSIRALLHQRLLLGLMLASLALTIVCSVVLSSAHKNINASFADDQTTTNSFMGKSQMSEVDRRKFRESMDSASSSIQAMFYQVASFGGSIVALFIFSTAVTSEVRRGSIRLTLSKPVSRTEFLFGKYLGGVAVMAAFALLTSLAILIFARSYNLELSPTVKWAPWLMFCRQLMLGSLAMLLSLFMHPVVAAVLAFVAGNGFYSPPNPLYFILPSYKDFNVFFQILQGTLLSVKDVMFLSLYALDFVIIILLLALWRFRTKELV
jgi:ABC-type transport system involved in multi-copper enzyme maturation permease subunit